MSARAALVASVAASLVIAVAPDASAWTPLDNGAPRWDQLPAGYYINQSTIPGSISNIAIARVDAGFASWSAPGCTEWQAVNLGNTNGSYNYNDGKNTFRWISGSWPGQLGDVNSVIGVTLPIWDVNDVIYDADMVFNNVGFCWNDSGNGGCVDTQSIATHEEGHFLGLGHTNVSGATMEAFYGGGSSLRSLAQDDIDGVCALYPPGGTVATSTGSGGSDCQGCVNGSVSNGGCVGEYDACGASQNCLSFYDCISGCSSQSCVDNCVSQFPQGAQIYSELINCICQDCATECSQECGGGTSSSTTSSTGTQSGATTAGAGGGDPGAGGSGGSGGASNNDDADADTGCSCSVGGPSAGLGGLVLAAAFGALASRRRRRRG